MRDRGAIADGKCGGIESGQEADAAPDSGHSSSFLADEYYS